MNQSRPIAIIGAGSIGLAWAIVFARAKFPVQLYDPSADQLARAKSAIAERLDRLFRIHVLLAHEPGRVVGADRQQRGVEWPHAPADFAEARAAGCNRKDLQLSALFNSQQQAAQSAMQERLARTGWQFAKQPTPFWLVP